MPGRFIDFRDLRRQLRIRDVLAHYGVQLDVRGSRATGLCPLPSHPKRSNGKRTASFSVDLERGLFNCFGCHRGGNALDLAIACEGKDPDNPADVRTVAVKLADEFNIKTMDANAVAVSSSNTRPHRRAMSTAVETHVIEPDESAAGSNAIVNPPLEFALKVDSDHTYLASRGFSAETVRHFGLGHCGRGLLKDRIAIPLHDDHGRLVGYAGRLTDDAVVGEPRPKYLFPGSRERDGQRIEFRKGELVYNLHRLPERVNALVVAEGFASVWWLCQHGYANAVALMGGSCTDAQASLICGRLADHGTLVVLTDGDDAGRACAADLFVTLGYRRRLFHARLDDGEQPTDLTSDELDGLLSPLVR